MAMNRNSLLYIAIAIPILMVTITVIGVRFYHVDLQPKYNYLYAVLDNTDPYQCEQRVTQEIYPKQTNEAFKQPCKKPNFYIYNFKNDTSTPTTLEQAKKLNLSDPQKNPTSPDGFRMQRYCSTYHGSWWWDFSMFDACVVKDSTQKRLVLKKYSANDSYTRLVLLGWVLETPLKKN